MHTLKRMEGVNSGGRRQIVVCGYKVMKRGTKQEKEIVFRVEELFFNQIERV